jgi:hypothetical protein
MVFVSPVAMPGESKLTKTETGSSKDPLYSIYCGLRGKLSTNYLESDNLYL